MYSESPSSRTHIQATCIEDVIGYEGIEAFVDRALELGTGTVGMADDAEVERFIQGLCGSYSNQTGLQCNQHLRHVYLPCGYVNVHIHDSGTGELMCGVYDTGRQPVCAASVALAIATRKQCMRGATTATIARKSSEIPGMLEICVSFSRP